MSNVVISKKDTKTAKDLIEQIRSLSFKLMDEGGNPKYDLKVWKMFLAFVDFWESSEAELLETEVFLYSDTLKVAGTCDLVCKINGELWVIDLKTSNHLQTTYDLQTAIYARCFEECYDQKVDRVGVLWLKSRSRGADKTGKKLKCSKSPNLFMKKELI
mgnify:CR=1 FL=1